MISKIILNNIKYNTKKEVIKIIQKILNNNSLNTWLKREDTTILLSLLKYHPNYNIKRGVGIIGFKIQLNNYNRKSFIIYRRDKSYTDFSYLKCITRPSLEYYIKQACRKTISSDIIKFKQNIFNKYSIVKCKVSKVIVEFNKCHVDHYNPTFKVLFSTWRKHRNITLKDLNISVDNTISSSFSNLSLKKDFKNYHNKHANLRIVSPKVNLSLLRKNYGNRR